MPTTPDLSSSCPVPLCGLDPFGGWLSVTRYIAFLCLHLCLPYLGVGETYSASSVPTKGLLDLTTPGQIRSLLKFSHLPIHFASSYNELTNELSIYPLHCQGILLMEPGLCPFCVKISICRPPSPSNHKLWEAASPNSLCLPLSIKATGKGCIEADWITYWLKL